MYSGPANLLFLSPPTLKKLSTPLNHQTNLEQLASNIIPEDDNFSHTEYCIALGMVLVLS